MTVAGSYPGAGGASVWDGERWVEGGSGDVLAAGATVRDPWFAHLLRYLCVGMLVGATTVVGVGVIWLAVIHNRTGRRYRDILLFVVPIVGPIVSVYSLWRYTARSAYWTPRADRQSGVLSGPARPAAIACGGVVLAAYLGAVGFGVLTADPTPSGWSREFRAGFVAEVEGAGATPAEASCLASQIETAFDGREPSDPEDLTPTMISDAQAACGLVPGP